VAFLSLRPVIVVTAPREGNVLHRAVITISITSRAFDAIAVTLPDGRKPELCPDGKGSFFVTLPNGVLDRLRALRGPGESYSDVIVRLAKR
jgi:hypothetical protein